MDRFRSIKEKLLALAREEEDITAVVLIGSSTRAEVKADEYSDLDVVLATERPEEWLYGDRPGRLGNVKISFVEPTLGGGKERRMLYEGSLDVDLIVFTPDQFEKAIREGVASWVMNRGYEVLYDAKAYASLLAEHISHELRPTDLSEPEFNNMVNDFCFHTVWAYKKILRGELWTAKMCIDAYLKSLLLKIIEMDSVSKHHVDVWHDGRFLDRWAEKEILSDLENALRAMTERIWFPHCWPRRTSLAGWRARRQSGRDTDIPKRPENMPGYCWKRPNRQNRRRECSLIAWEIERDRGWAGA